MLSFTHPNVIRSNFLLQNAKEGILKNVNQTVLDTFTFIVWVKPVETFFKISLFVFLLEHKKKKIF